MGQKLVFIVLKMTRACVKKRLVARHGGDESSDLVKSLEAMHALYEDVGVSEPQAYTVTVDEDTTKDEVVAKVVEILGTHQA